MVESLKQYGRSLWFFVVSSSNLNERGTDNCWHVQSGSLEGVQPDYNNLVHHLCFPCLRNLTSWFWCSKSYIHTFYVLYIFEIFVRFINRIDWSYIIKFEFCNFDQEIKNIEQGINLCNGITKNHTRKITHHTHTLNNICKCTDTHLSTTGQINASLIFQK